MVLWELTLTTAYFLGLRRTYRLALRIQRRLIGPNNPRIRQFLHRRTRTIFDVVVKVHHNVQQRDIEAGRNLGSWILRWLDRIKPSAEIRSHSANRLSSSSSSNLIPEQPTSYRRPMASHKHYAKIADTVSRGRLLFARWNSMAKYSPAVAMLMMRPTLGMNGQLRQIYDCSTRGPAAYRGYGGVFREDIALLLERN